METLRAKLSEVTKLAEYAEIFGVSIDSESSKSSPDSQINFVLEKFLPNGTTLDDIQISIALHRLSKILMARKRVTCIRKEFQLEHKHLWEGISHMTLQELEKNTPEPEFVLPKRKQLTVWLTLNEQKLRTLGKGDPRVRSASDWRDWIRAIAERMARNLVYHGTEKTMLEAKAILVVDCEPLAIRHQESLKKMKDQWRNTIRSALQYFFRSGEEADHYPNLISNVYIINPPLDLLTYSNLPRHATDIMISVAQKADLVNYLSNQIPSEYGGEGPSLQTADIQWSPFLNGTEQNYPPEFSELREINEADSKIAMSLQSPHPNPTPVQIPKLKSESEPEWSELIGKPEWGLTESDIKDPKNNFENYGPGLWRLDDIRFVKFGEKVRLAEAEAMFLVAKYTSVPVPKVECAYVLEGQGFIIMSYEEGVTLREYWSSATPEQRESVVSQLTNYVHQMRTLIQPSGFIGSVDKSFCSSGIFLFAQDRTITYGPYNCEQEFNEGIVSAIQDSYPMPRSSGRKLKTCLDDLDDSYGDHIIRHFQFLESVRSLKGHRIVFTHGDLHDRNILVRKDGTLLVLDFDGAGFFPEYFEWYTATLMGFWDPALFRVLHKIIPPFYTEALILYRVFAEVVG
ncbi:hypothetical protein AA313_de0206716 [Arthrobotrys entomopaga]|nr:hypothetical protein AA313_de0206716 [Arthrobotrys entomopaga]